MKSITITLDHQFSVECFEDGTAEFDYLGWVGMTPIERAMKRKPELAGALCDVLRDLPVLHPLTGERLCVPESVRLSALVEVGSDSPC